MRYPTVKFFKDGKLVEEYNGPRNSDGVIEYLLKSYREREAEL